MQINQRGPIRAGTISALTRVQSENDSRDASNVAAESGPIAVKPGTDRRNRMKSSTQDEAEGKLHKVKGSIKEIAGKLTKNRKLVRKGKAEKRAGKAQEKVGQVKKVLGK
jgi:uncharacterized protein YjbJ (UPF0337 family)